MVVTFCDQFEQELARFGPVERIACHVDEAHFGSGVAIFRFGDAGIRVVNDRGQCKAEIVRAGGVERLEMTAWARPFDAVELARACAEVCQA